MMDVRDAKNIVENSRQFPFLTVYEAFRTLQIFHGDSAIRKDKLLNLADDLFRRVGRARIGLPETVADMMEDVDRKIRIETKGGD